jgi:hypothetical protein
MTAGKSKSSVVAKLLIGLGILIELSSIVSHRRITKGKK